MPAQDAYAYAVEVVGARIDSRGAFTYPVEVVGARIDSRGAFTYPVEVVGPKASLAASPAAFGAYVAAVENVVPPVSPVPKLMIWNPATSQYERDPWMVWNGAAWVQAV